MNGKTVIGIDLGGTNLRGGLVKGDSPEKIFSEKINSRGSEEEVLMQLFRLTDQMVNGTVKAIGVGVPSVVDTEQGIVYDVQNIPSWKEVPLKRLMEERYGLPVIVNNDANCFALAEYYFGGGRNADSMIGLTVGTGLGAGIILNGRLYAGSNCGAGEFGMVEYLDRYYEYYACGQFFQNIYQTDGEEVFKRASTGDGEALGMYGELGTHLGNAIRMILYTYDPALIVMGGSVSRAWPYFSANMWERISTLVYPRSVERLNIVLSQLQHAGILGAAALYQDFLRK